MGTMHELNKTGDTKTMWDPRNSEEVENARRTFDDLMSRGFSIFNVDSAGGKGVRMTKFDPKAGKLIAVPAIVGG